MNKLRGSCYLDRRTANNIMNMSGALSDIAGRLRRFGFDDEADRADQLTTGLAALASGLADKIGKRRIRRER